MANSFLKGTQIAAQALGLLEREIVLPRLVTRYGAADFIGQANDTVTIRVPAIAIARDYEFRTRTAPIVIDELNETAVTVVLDKHPMSAVAITDEQLTLDITNFGAQVTAPQVKAVAYKLEDIVAAEISGAPYNAAMTVTGASGSGGISDGEAFRIATAARKALNLKNVPMGGRILLLGADVEELFLNDKRFNTLDESGTVDALREAKLGRIAGFDVYLSNAIASDEAYAFHPTAFGLAIVAPNVPAGVADGGSIAADGLAMRWIRDYDTNYARDRSVVSTFAGSSTTLEGADDDDVDTDKELLRAVKIEFTEAA